MFTRSIMLGEYINQLDKLPQKTLANYAEIDPAKPLIGIVCAQNELTASQSGLDVICSRVRDGIIASNATAKICYVPSSDSTAMHGTAAAKYDLPSRDLTANAVELLCSGEMFDGLVFVASETNTVCGMLLGAIRMNLPCAFVCQGTMEAIFDGKTEHGFVYVYEQIARIKTGRSSYEEIERMEKNLPLCFGTDCERYGANSFNCLLEATGLAVRDNGTAPAGSAARKRIAFETGKLAVKLASIKWTPRRALNQTSMSNLVTLDLACGGSSTTMLNLIAVARELGVRNVNFKTIGDAAKSTPLLLCSADSQKCIMQQFYGAGGVYAMLKQLLDAELINGNAAIFDDATLRDMIADVTVADPNVIRSAENKVAASSNLRTIYGNVAEGGAFVHCAGKTSFTGSARVYQNEEMAVDALLHREIKAGDVVVIQGEGPKSGPGMREIFASLALLKGYGLGEKVAVITDGRIADFYNGIVIGHVTPETGEQNLFSVLQDGDEIEINLTKGKVSLDIKAKELTMRYRQHENSVGNYGNFYLKNWAKNCGTAVEGCVYKPQK